MKLTIAYGLSLIGCIMALTNLDQSARIIFDPTTDGPIRVEKRPSYAAPIGGVSGTCLTSMSTDGGRTGSAVYTPCSTSTTSTYTVQTIGGGGGGGGAGGTGYGSAR